MASGNAAAPDCPFCLENDLLTDTPVHIGRHHFILRQRNPARRHGVILVPLRHVTSPFEMSPEAWADLPEALAIARQMLDPDEAADFTLGWNIGVCAGQHVQHAHLHLIRRAPGGGDAGRGLHALIETCRAKDS